MTLSCCPVRFITQDIMRLADAYFLADKRVSFAEQRSMCAPYAEALMYLQSELAGYRANEMKKEESRMRMIGNRK